MKYMLYNMIYAINIIIIKKANIILRCLYIELEIHLEKNPNFIFYK